MKKKRKSIASRFDPDRVFPKANKPFKWIVNERQHERQHLSPCRNACTWVLCPPWAGEVYLYEAESPAKSDLRETWM